MRRAVLIAAFAAATSSAQAQPAANPYAGNAQRIAEGAKLFVAYNCMDCHGPEGSGAIISINGYTTLIPGMEGYGLWPAEIERYRGRVRLVANRDLGLFYYKRQAH